MAMQSHSLPCGSIGFLSSPSPPTKSPTLPIGFSTNKYENVQGKIEQCFAMVQGENLNIMRDGNQTTFKLNELLSVNLEQPKSSNFVSRYKYTIHLSFCHRSESKVTNECVDVDLYINNECLYNQFSERFTDVLSIKSQPSSYYSFPKQYDDDDKDEHKDQMEEVNLGQPQMALDIFQISCDGLCGLKHKPNQLFFCGHKDCEPQQGLAKLLCVKCGACSHEFQQKSHVFSSLKDHVVCVEDLMKPNEEHYKAGWQSGTLIKHIGTIKKILFRQRWLFGVVSHTAGMGGATGASFLINGAPTVVAACAEGGSVIHSALGVAASGASIGAAIGTGIEWAYIGWQLYKKRITNNEAVKLGLTALAANTVSAGSYFGFMALGAAVGTPAGPVGSVICAVIAAVLCGLGTRFLVNKTCEKYFDTKHEQKIHFQKEALRFFFNNEEYDINDESKFNEKIVKRTYRRLAVICHPDRKGGDHEEWLKLSAYYGVLTAIVEETEQQANDAANAPEEEPCLSVLIMDVSL
eukprot:1127786_1